MLYATRVIVDLAAISHNLCQVRAQVGAARMLVAVKADAYGHGAVAIALDLQRRGLADYLGVATTAEGIDLRAAGVTLPILRLSPAFDEEADALVAHRITPTLADEHTIKVLAGAARSAGVADYPVHLAIDTGMRRIGCEPDQAVRLARKVIDSGLILEGIFTHLPVSDTPEGQDFTGRQVATFSRQVDRINADRGAGLGPVPLVHAANSGAILSHLATFSMVRVGIATYGYYPDARTPHTVPLVPALRWVSRVGCIKRVAAGQTVGYGRTWTAPEDCWIATIPVGYADGYSRLNSNRGRMLIGGRSCPVAGRVCMDQTMVNLGPVDEPCSIKVGDEVVICGRQGGESISADEIAGLMGTITYEVTCLIGARVHREYVNPADEK